MTLPSLRVPNTALTLTVTLEIAQNQKAEAKAKAGSLGKVEESSNKGDVALTDADSYGTKVL